MAGSRDDKRCPHGSDSHSVRPKRCHHKPKPATPSPLDERHIQKKINSLGDLTGKLVEHVTLDLRMGSLSTMLGTESTLIN